MFKIQIGRIYKLLPPNPKSLIYFDINNNLPIVHTKGC